LDSGIAEEATRELSVREREGFLLTFSLTSKSSFEAIPTYMEKITRIKDNRSVPIVLVTSLDFKSVNSSRLETSVISVMIELCPKKKQNH
jgi:hypothetical protein